MPDLSGLIAAQLGTYLVSLLDNLLQTPFQPEINFGSLVNVLTHFISSLLICKSCMILVFTADQVSLSE